MKNPSLRASLLAAFIAFTAGCGASTPPAETAHGEHADGEKREHHKLAGAAHEFHEVLAPLWHAEKGAAREAKVCDAVPAFEERGAGVAKESPDAASQGLVTAVGELKTECAKPAGGRADFDAKFAGVHDAFHKVIEGKH